MIPTRNRPAFIRRQLSYYGQSGFSGAVIIADSSDADAFHSTAQWLRGFERSFSVSHSHLPGLSFAGAVREVRGEVKSPFVAVVPDDDFLVPSTIEKCAAVLDQHSDCVAARGFAVLIQAADGSSTAIDAVGPYPQPAITGESAADRVVNYLRAYSVTLFATHRTGPWEKGYAATPSTQIAPLCCDRAFSDELLQCSMTVAFGKVATVDQLYLVRQVHQTRNLLDPWYRWMTDEKWRPSLNWFRDHVASAIVEVDGIAVEAARDAVDAGLSAYLRRVMNSGTSVPQSKTRRARQAAQRSLPRSVLTLARRFRSQLQPGYVSLEGLLDPRSEFHRDFLPIYHAVTNS